MKGLLLYGPKDLRFDELKEDVPGDSDVLVRIDNIGICGSDLHLFAGDYQGPHKYPMFFGHEWAGTVEEIGRNVEGLKKGDRVTGDCSRWCGTCRMCVIDKNLCLNIEKFGISVDGASRELFAVHHKYLYRASTADLKVLSLAEPLAVAAHALSKVEPVLALESARILVMGAGTIGLSTLLILRRYYGKSSVEVLEMLPARLNAAVSFGARPSALIQENHPDSVSQTSWAGLYSAKDTFDLIVDTTGNPKAMSMALRLVAPLGTILCIGFLPASQFDLRQIVAKSATITGSIGGTGHFDRAVKVIEEYPADCEMLVTHRFRAADAEAAFYAAASGQDAIKVQIVFGGEDS